MLDRKDDLEEEWFYLSINYQGSSLGREFQVKEKGANGISLVCSSDRVKIISRAALSSRTFCSGRNVLYLHCTLWDHWRRVNGEHLNCG